MLLAVQGCRKARRWRVIGGTAAVRRSQWIPAFAGMTNAPQGRLRPPKCVQRSALRAIVRMVSFLLSADELRA
jgi:hypothetical protein